ncbi:MAG: PD40 domain-containing protein [Saprospiraceae bacterium]|nr:PD40 domain-containing protein [Pyrinomonadaceae bacterium]
MLLSKQNLQFGDFSLDLKENVLLLDKRPVQITPKALLLLRSLVENHGHIVEKEQLIRAVWPDSFVEEGNLSFTVNLLRKALGDDSQNPRFIETVPRRGYRFIAPVSEASNGNASEKTFGQSYSVQKGAFRKYSPTYLLPFLLFSLLAVLGTGIWYATSKNQEPAAPILSALFSAEKLPTSGNSEFAAISPDGKYAAYTDETGGKRNIWLRNLESSENLQVVPPSDDYYFDLDFSNSSESLFFVRKPASGHVSPALYKIAAIGGVPVKILDNVTRAVSFSQDDKQITFVRCAFKKDDFCSLYLADFDGGNEQKLLTTSNGIHITESHFSPDGRSVAVASGRSDSDAGDAGISEIIIDTGAQREMLERKFYDIKSLKWLPNGTGVLFTATRHKDGKESVWLASATTDKAVPLTRDAASYSRISLDKTGSKMIAVQPTADFRINILSNRETKTLANARDLTFANDGKIIYSTFDGEIWIVNRDGSEQRQLTNNDFIEGSPRISPDGTSIYFASNESGSRHVWRMNPDGTNRSQITKQNGGVPVSADGGHVYYVSSSNDLLYKVSAEGGEETLVHDKKMQRPAVSPDGTLIAYFFLDNKEFKIAVMRSDDKEIIKVLKYGNSFVQRLAWSADNKTLNYILDSNGRNSLWRQSIDEQAPQLVDDLGGEEIRYFAVSQTDNIFSYIRGKWNYDVVLLTGLQ